MPVCARTNRYVLTVLFGSRGNPLGPIPPPDPHINPRVHLDHSIRTIHALRNTCGSRQSRYGGYIGLPPMLRCAEWKRARVYKAIFIGYTIGNVCAPPFCTYSRVIASRTWPQSEVAVAVAACSLPFHSLTLSVAHTRNICRTHRVSTMHGAWLPQHISISPHVLGAYLCVRVYV